MEGADDGGVVSLDGASAVLMCEDGSRKTMMVGTISFYDGEGERQHTIYLAATPEYGKATFLGELGVRGGPREGDVLPAHFVGIADGARGIGNSWSGIPRPRWWTSGMRRSIWARRRRCCTGEIPRRASRGPMRVAMS